MALSLPSTKKKGCEDLQTCIDQASKFTLGSSLFSSPLFKASDH